MKTIKNKITEIVLKLDEKGNPIFASFGDLLLLTINMAPQQGFSIIDIRERLLLAEKIELGKEGVIEITNSEATLLKSSFDSFKWVQIHKDLVELSDILNSL
jgi:hypothetical protein